MSRVHINSFWIDANLRGIRWLWHEIWDAPFLDKQHSLRQLHPWASRQGLLVVEHPLAGPFPRPLQRYTVVQEKSIVLVYLDISGISWYILVYLGISWYILVIRAHGVIPCIYIYNNVAFFCILYTCIYIHLYTSIYIIMHVYASIHIYIHLYTSIYIYIHLYTSIYIYIHLYTSIYIYIHLYTSIYSTSNTVYKNIYGVYLCIHIYIYMYTSVLYILQYPLLWNLRAK